MSIEQKIAEMLAESKAAAQFDQEELVEEVEELDEISVDLLKRARDKAERISGDSLGKNPIKMKAYQRQADTFTDALHKKYKAQLSSGKRKYVEEVEEELGDEVEDVELDEATDINDPSKGSEQNPENKKNDVRKQEIGGKSKVANVVTKGASAPEASHLSSVKEDVAALVNGEDLSEEFKQKAATIFEAAIVTRVKQEVARLEEEFEQRVEEGVEQRYEGLIEKVDGYLNYIVESWIEQNEIALERGMKSEILENFVHGLKNLFEENYIDVPEEKYDLLGEMEETIVDLKAKLNEQLEANVELNSLIAEAQRGEIIAEACSGLTDTEVEKFVALAEELSYEDSDTFANKVHTIRENYFNVKPMTKVVDSVVTDEPVVLTEETAIDPTMKRYVSALNILK
jgi:hypothetical protein